MKYLKNVLLLFSLTITFTLSLNIKEAESQSCDETINFINEISAKTLSIVNTENYTINQKKYRLSNLLLNNADFKTMGKVALGRYSRKLPKDREEQYTILIKNMVTDMIHTRLNTNVEEEASSETPEETSEDDADKAEEK